MKSDEEKIQQLAKSNEALRKQYPFLDKPNLIIVPKQHREDKHKYFSLLNENRKKWLIENNPKLLELYIKRWTDEFQQ